jgi:hypothetical protein
MWRRRSVRKTLLGPQGWSSTGPEVSFRVLQGTGEEFQCLGAYNESNLQNASRRPKIIKKMGPSWADWPSKRLRCEIAEELLNVVRNDESTCFSHVATGDESIFSCCYQSTQCHGKFRMEVSPRTKTTIAARRVIVTIYTGRPTRTWASQYRQNKTSFLNDVYLSLLSTFPIGNDIFH